MKAGIIVSVLIQKEDKILMVQEGKVDESKGMWNLPSGRLEENETIKEGAIREAKEETGYDISADYISGVYKYISASGMPLVRFNFIGEIIGGSLEIDHQEIIDAKWFTMRDILEIPDNQIWNAGSVKTMIEDIIAGKKYSADLIRDMM